MPPTGKPWERSAANSCPTVAPLETLIDSFKDRHELGYDADDGGQRQDASLAPYRGAFVALMSSLSFLVLEVARAKGPRTGWGRWGAGWEQQAALRTSR